MSVLPRGNRDLIKEMNTNLVLNLIKTHGSISQRDIVQFSGLSPATVSGLVADLASRDLIREIGVEEAPGRRGRRPVLLCINSQVGFVIGVKVMEDGIAVALTDLEARVIHFQDTSFETVQNDVSSVSGRTPDMIVQIIISAIEKVIKDSGVDVAKILGIGLGISGLIDSEAGICRYSRIFQGYRDVALVAPLAEHFPFPVSIENDVKARTIAEQWFGHGHGVDNFIFVTIGRGIGAGIVINGQFYRGAHNGAGEFGHVTMQVDGPSCECGNRGCLEAMASDPAIIAAVQSALTRGEPSLLTHTVPLTMADVIAAAEQGDIIAQQELGRSGELIGTGIAHIVNLLNPGLIIIGGEGVNAGKWRLDPLYKALRASTFHGLYEKLEIVIQPAGDETWARGAACVLLGEWFKSPIHK